MRLHHGSQSPLQCNALFDGDGQLPKVLNLLLKEVQNIRIRSELLPLGRGITDLLESMERREQGVTSPTLLDSL